ncbi:MAG: CAP domain-containing protein [Clostridium sp.]|nr:CAP domain-containing protein [Clostridium sp.]
MAQVEQLIYQKVNEERAKVGISQLSYNSTMEKYARIKSKDMGDNNYFSHEDLSGKLITEKMKQDGVSYKAWGENIAYIGGVSDANKLAEQFMTNWMNSSGHRANILSTNFESIGIGVYKSGNRVYATQEFYK